MSIRVCSLDVQADRCRDLDRLGVSRPANDTYGLDAVGDGREGRCGDQRCCLILVICTGGRPDCWAIVIGGLQSGSISGPNTSFYAVWSHYRCVPSKFLLFSRQDNMRDALGIGIACLVVLPAAVHASAVMAEHLLTVCGDGLWCGPCLVTYPIIVNTPAIRRQNFANFCVGWPRAGARLRRGCPGSPSAAAAGVTVASLSFTETLERTKP